LPPTLVCICPQTFLLELCFFCFFWFLLGFLIPFFVRALVSLVFLVLPSVFWFLAGHVWVVEGVALIPGHFLVVVVNVYISLSI